MAIYNTLSDQELTDLLKSGDQGAYTVIYNRYWRLIYMHVFKMLRDEDDAKILYKRFLVIYGLR